MGPTPTLSILIPTYHRVALLARLLERLGADAEVIANGLTVLVSDNASPDGTAEAVRRLQAEMPALDIRLHVQHENIGPVANMRWLIEHAPPTDYVWLLGDDDQPLPGSIGCVLATLDDERPALLHLPHRFESGDGSHADSPCPPALERFPSSRELLARYHHWLTFISATVVERSAFVRAVRAAPTESPWAPYIWFTLAGCEGPCAVAGRRLVSGGGEIGWREQFRQYVTTEVVSAYDEGFHLVLDESEYGRVLDGWYGTFGTEHWEPAGVEAIRSAVQRFPSARGLRSLLWRLARRDGRLELLATVEDAVHAADDAVPAAALISEGEQRYLEGDLSGATVLFQRAIELHPTSADAWTDLGVAMHALGSPEARAAFDCALQIEPEHPEALLSRAQC